MTIDHIKKAYSLWWELNDTIGHLDLAIKYLYDGDFEGMATQLGVGGFPAREWCADDWIYHPEPEQEPCANLAAPVPAQASLFEANP